MRHLHLFFLLTTISYWTKVNAQTYIGPEEDIQAILENAKSFSQYFMEGEMDKIVACYTDSGKIFPTGMDIMSGKAALSTYWQRGEEVKALYHKLTPIEIVVTGDRATDYGYYEGKTQYKDNPVSSWRGKYLVVWKKVDGLWKMDLDMWNSIQDPQLPSADEAAVRVACMNYINTFYNADTTLAYQSIHPSLRKVGFYFNNENQAYSKKLEMPFTALISLAKTWNAAGDKVDEESPKQVQILELSDKTAVAKVTAIWGIDYISLAKMDDQWMILNVLWQSAPR